MIPEAPREKLTRERYETLRALVRLRAYVRYLWDAERDVTERGPLPSTRAICNLSGIEHGEPWPNRDGTIRRQRPLWRGYSYHGGRPQRTCKTCTREYNRLRIRAKRRTEPT